MYGARRKASFFVHVYVPESYVQSATGKLPKYFVLEWLWHAPCMHGDCKTYRTPTYLKRYRKDIFIVLYYWYEVM